MGGDFLANPRARPCSWVKNTIIPLLLKWNKSGIPALE